MILTVAGDNPDRLEATDAASSRSQRIVFADATLRRLTTHVDEQYRRSGATDLYVQSGVLDWMATDARGSASGSASGFVRRLPFAGALSCPGPGPSLGPVGLVDAGRRTHPLASRGDRLGTASQGAVAGERSSRRMPVAQLA